MLVIPESAEKAVSGPTECQRTRPSLTTTVTQGVTIMADANYPTPVLHALKLLRQNPQYLTDARQGSIAGNSVAGAVLSLTLQVPRAYAEKAVREALDVLEQETTHG